MVVATAEPDALREASYFTDRLQAEGMPLAGLVLNRTHPPLADLTLGPTEAAAARLATSSPIAAGVMRVHADRLTMNGNEQRMRSRFVRAHPTLPVVAVPAAAGDVHDVDGLRAIGEQLGRFTAG